MESAAPDNPATALPKIQWFQYRLRTLMIAITFFCGACAVGGHWYRLRQRADAAFMEREMQRIITPDEIVPGPGRITRVLWEPTIQASRNWCLAECEVPFADHEGACRWYVQLVERTEAMTIGYVQSAAFTTEKDAAKLRAYKREANEWLSRGTANGKPSVIDNHSE